MFKLDELLSELTRLEQQNAELLEALKVLMDDRHNWEAWLDAENVIAKAEGGE